MSCWFGASPIRMRDTILRRSSGLLVSRCCCPRLARLMRYCSMSLGGVKKCGLSPNSGVLVMGAPRCRWVSMRCRRSRLLAAIRRTVMDDAPRLTRDSHNSEAIPDMRDNEASLLCRDIPVMMDSRSSTVRKSIACRCCCVFCDEEANYKQKEQTQQQQQ